LQKAHRTCPAKFCPENGQSALRAVDPEAVGAENPNAPPGNLDDLFFQPPAFGGSGLPEPGGQDFHCLDPLAEAFLQGVFNRRRRNGHDGEIHFPGDLLERTVGLKSVDISSFGVHGIDSTLEADLQDGAEDDIAKLGHIRRSADDRQGSGVKDRFKGFHDRRIHKNPLTCLYDCQKKKGQ
jgi:hypothetical protein